MPRNGEPARLRLQQAAVELFGERGYDQTTAAEIAARAGVTERTFFRHFADKREALFDGQSKLREALTKVIAEAPAKLEPLEILDLAFRAIVPLLEANRPFALPRQHVIASSPALQERELAKEAALAESVALALRQRGVEERLASLVARTGMATLRYAIENWFVDPAEGLETHLERAFSELDGLASWFSARKARRQRIAMGVKRKTK